jgi:hypothetical protein
MQYHTSLQYHMRSLQYHMRSLQYHMRSLQYHMRSLLDLTLPVSRVPMLIGGACRSFGNWPPRSRPR